MHKIAEKNCYLENMFGSHEWFSKLEVGKIAVPIRGSVSSIIEFIVFKLLPDSKWVDIAFPLHTNLVIW